MAKKHHSPESMAVALDIVAKEEVEADPAFTVPEELSARIRDRVEAKLDYRNHQKYCDTLDKLLETLLEKPDLKWNTVFIKTCEGGVAFSSFCSSRGLSFETAVKLLMPKPKADILISRLKINQHAF
jgi:hypothetical protein